MARELTRGPRQPVHFAKGSGEFGRRAAGWLLAGVVSLWLRTLRILVIDRTSEASRASPAPWVLVFFHGTQFPLLAWSRRRQTAVLVSLSHDGALQTAVMTRVGMTVVRGSSSRRGAEGLTTLVRALRRTALDSAFAVDGPRGPRHTVHGGAIACARLTGGSLVPIGGAASPATRLTRTWDQFAIPWPFSRAVVVVGPELPPTTAPAELQRAIHAVNGDARRALSA